jgi:hypothetical protein
LRCWCWSTGCRGRCWSLRAPRSCSPLAACFIPQQSDVLAANMCGQHGAAPVTGSVSVTNARMN